MADYQIKDLNLSPCTRRVLSKMRIKTTDELRCTSMYDLLQICRADSKAFGEVRMVLEQLRKHSLEKRVMMDFSSEQFVEMSVHAIDELGLSKGTYQVLKNYNLLQIDEVALLTEDDFASYEGINEQIIEEILDSLKNWVMHHLVLSELQQTYFRNSDGQNEDIVYFCPFPITDSLLQLVGRRSVSDLNLSILPENSLKRHGIETMAQLALLESDTFLSIKHFRKTDARNVENTLFAWIYDRCFNRTLLPDFGRGKAKCIRAIEDCVKTLKPTCNVICAELYILLQSEDKLDLLDLSGTEEGRIHNCKLTLSLEGIENNNIHSRAQFCIAGK